MKTLPDDPGYHGDPKRGASMGRPSKGATPRGKVSLRRVRINSGGYDSGGAYWGLGQPLYWASDGSGEFDTFFRASDRAAAKAVVRKVYPEAVFYRYCPCPRPVMTEG